MSYSPRNVTNSQTATIDDFIDVIMKDHRKYIRWYGLSSPPTLKSKH